MKHQKHSKIAKAETGNFAKLEVSFLGTNCTQIKNLFEAIIDKLSPFKVAVIDADHHSESALSTFITSIDKISHYRIDLQERPNKFQFQYFTNEADIVLINGNHETANSQIIIIDEAKPLTKKIDKLTNIELIVFKDKLQVLPEYLINVIGEQKDVIKTTIEDIDTIADFLRNKIINNIPPMNGLVLRGGKSQRMGFDKALIDYHGLPQKNYTFQLLQPKCHQTFVSINPQQSEELPAITDTFIGLGPLSGILSAFMQNPNAAWLVVACDLPYLTDKTLDFLIQNRNSSKIATAFVSPTFSGEEQAFPEPLITIYEPKAYPILMQMLSLGIDCPRKTLINFDIELVQLPEPKEVFNANTPSEHQKAIIDLSPKIT